MKRNKPLEETLDEAGIFEYKSWFFWRMCHVCKKEFRRESGWIYFQNKGFATGDRRGVVLSIYGCHDCLSTELAAYQYFHVLKQWLQPPRGGSGESKR